MNIAMIAAATGQGINPALPSHEGMLFSLFLAVAGVVLLTAAALWSAAPRQAVRYVRSRRGPNGL